MRAALYARFSTEMQSAASIPDQLRVCRRHAESLAAEVVDEFSDAAISGRAMGNRPGLLQLMAAARAGAFDVVVAEHMDRLSRSGGDSWAIFEDLRAAGVEIHTANQGAISAMHVGLSGTMSALLIEETARKVRRGLEGVTRDGRSAGGLSYGYRKVIKLDTRGEPIRGLREIAPEEAEVVVRIFRAYAAGRSPRGIAADLNGAGVPGPSGGHWNTSTISGNAQRGNGVIHNELYRGVIVWGRNAWVKDRVSGKRRSRAGSEPAIVRHDAPALRIVEEPLWAAVRARYANVSESAAGGRPVGARRPSRLLSGLVACGCCGSRMVVSGSPPKMRCQVSLERGRSVCSNGRVPGYPALEARVLASIRANLLHPAVVEAAVEEHRRLRGKRDAEATRRRSTVARELAEVIRRSERLVDQVAEGAVGGRAVSDKLKALEERRTSLEAAIATASRAEDVAVMHPSAAGRYRQLVDRLHEALIGDDVETVEAREALRGLITAVVFRPLPAQGSYALEVEADLAPLLAPARDFSPGDPGSNVSSYVRKLGAGVGFEPTTFRL